MRPFWKIDCNNLGRYIYRQVRKGTTLEHTQTMKIGRILLGVPSLDFIIQRGSWQSGPIPMATSQCDEHQTKYHDHHYNEEQTRYAKIRKAHSENWRHGKFSVELVTSF